MKKEEVGTRLSALENNIRGTFDNYTNFELDECDSAIKRRIDRLEYTLNGLRVASPSQVDAMLNELKRDLKGLKEIVEDNRDEEKRETISNLQHTSIELDETIQDLERFDEEGIGITGQNDIRFEDQVEEQISLELNKFIEENGIKDPNVVSEIKAEMQGLKRDLSRTHDQISVGMRKQIQAKVEYIGGELVSKKQERDEKENGTRTEKSPIAGLQDLTASQEEIAEFDVKSENEKAFKDIPTRDENSRQALEDMFK